MQYVIHSSSILAAALQHALKNVLGLADAFVESAEEGPHRVTLNGKTCRGLQAVLLALRMQADTEEQRAFLGCGDEEQAALVNQWVNAAAVLEADARRAASDATTSVAKSVYAELERILAAAPGSATQSLTGSPRATIADLLVYAAAFHHPLHAEVLPTTVAWATHAQEDAYLAPLRNAAVQSDAANTAAAATQQPKGGKGSAAAGAKAEVSYVKPSEEEIVRRRAEKEKAKAEKEAAKAAAAAAGGAKDASAGPSATTGKVELDSTSLYIRVGQLTNLRLHPTAERLYVEDMVLGDETRTIISGLVEEYTKEELEGTYCLVVCNMKPKPMMGVTSQGMVLCAKKEGEFKLIRPPAGAKAGDRVLFGPTYDAALAAAAPPAPVASSARMADVLSHLHTNSEGVLCWRDEPALYASGEKAAIPEMPNAPVS